MKIKHNKKRNTAFVYEALLREATVAVMRKDPKRRDGALALITKHFGSSSLLKQDLECYRSLYENQGLPAPIAEKIMREAKIANRLIDPEGLFKQQTELINDVNKTVSPQAFNNFVPNYKTLASIAQIFSGKASPKDSVILEGQLIHNMTQETTPGPVDPVDNIVYETFVKKFNTKYEDTLLEEQKELLSHYITSFTDNAVALKTFLNEEITRLKQRLEESKTTQELQNDPDMSEKADQIIDKLNSFSNSQIDESVLSTVIKTQQLVKEIYTDADHT